MCKAAAPSLPAKKPLHSRNRWLDFRIVASYILPFLLDNSRLRVLIVSSRMPFSFPRISIHNLEAVLWTRRM